MLNLTLKNNQNQSQEYDDKALDLVYEDDVQEDQALNDDLNPSSQKNRQKSPTFTVLREKLSDIDQDDTVKVEDVLAKDSNHLSANRPIKLRLNSDANQDFIQSSSTGG